MRSPFDWTPLATALAKDPNDALSLSNSYVQKYGLLNNVVALSNLQYRMVLDFTERVKQIRMGRQPSKPVIDVPNDIQHHLSEAITAKHIADHLFLSRPHLSTKFKAEAGMNLSDFIVKEKKREAKRLLRYSDETSYAIASFLGFASQSHFSLVFKKHTGKTPKEHRELQSRSSKIKPRYRRRIEAPFLSHDPKGSSRVRRSSLLLIRRHRRFCNL